MAKIILVCHGPLAQALVQAAESIIGAAADEVVAIALSTDDCLDGMRERLAAELDGSDEALILVDLFGGTPANAAAWASQGRCVEIVSGVNLPMLLEVLSQGAFEDAAKLAQVAASVGSEGIVNVGEILRGS